MMWSRSALAFAVGVAAANAASAQPLPPADVPQLLPVQATMPQVAVPGAPPPPAILLSPSPAPPPVSVPPAPPAVWLPPEPLFERQPPTLPPPAADADPTRFWFGAGLFLGFSSRSSPPSAWNVPATGATVSLPNGKHDGAFGTGLLLDGGYWFGPERKWAVDASYLTLDTWQRWRDPRFVPTPVASYRAGILDDVVRFDSTDVNLRRRLYSSDGMTLDGLVGYRYAGVRDVGWLDSVVNTAGGGIIIYSDRAKAVTSFHGGQLGLAAGWRFGRWSLDATGKVALGATHARIDFTGDSANAIRAGAPGVIPMLDRTRFAVLPSAGLTLSRDVGAWSRVSVGYTFQYLDNVARAADVFRAVGDPVGSPANGGSYFWAQGVTLNWQWRY